MRATKVLSITLPEAYVESAKKAAKKENRHMSELVREAFAVMRLRNGWRRSNLMPESALRGRVSGRKRMWIASFMSIGRSDEQVP